MARVSRVLPHLSEAEVKEKMRTARNFRQQQKWWIVYNALVAPRTAAEIAKHTGTNVRDVDQVISEYNRQGVAAIETPGSGGRRTQYLSVEEETSFLADLEPKAKRGQITTKAEVKVAFEKRVGQQVAKSTIYRLLNRHQWRKIKPRPRHPKSDPEEQAVFKNTFAQQIQQFEQQRDPNDKRPLLVMASDEGRFGRIGGVHRALVSSRFQTDHLSSTR